MSAEPGPFQRLVVGLMPSYLAGPWGSLFAAAHGLVLDALAQALGDAVLVSSVRHAPHDGLAEIGRCRRMPRYPTETLGAYRSRLLESAQAYADQSSTAGMVARYAEQGLVATVYENADWDWDGHPGHVADYWARMWIVLSGSHGYETTPSRYGTAIYGSGRYAVDMTDAEVAMVRAIAMKWKAARNHLVHVIVLVSGSLYGTGATYGNITYGGQAGYLDGD